MQIIEMAWALIVLAFLTIPFGRWEITAALAAAGIILYAILRLVLYELKLGQADGPKKEAPRR
jgi:hypothetical protein